MAAPEVKAFPFKMEVNSINSQQIGYLLPKDIEDMSIPEFYEYENRLVKVRRFRRRDMGVWQPNTLIRPNHEAAIFRNGVGDPQPFATDENASYKQTRVHTNMSKGGTFERGALCIIHAIEVPIVMCSKPTTSANGVVTNPKAIFLDGYDPALVGVNWANQTELSFHRGETEIFRGLLEDFPGLSNFNGVLGSNQGVLIQNGSSGMNIMPGVQVIEGGEDFHVRLHPLADWDTTTANGLAVQMVQQVKLHTIELVRDYK